MGEGARGERRGGEREAQVGKQAIVPLDAHDCVCRMCRLGLSNLAAVLAADAPALMLALQVYTHTHTQAKTHTHTHTHTHKRTHTHR